MASEFLKSNIVTGLAAGIGASLLAPVLLPFLARIARPITKSVIKTGITCYEKGIESFAELSETLDDLVAEAKVELGEHGSAPPGVATTGEPPSPTKEGNAGSGPAKASATQPSVSAEPAQKPSPPPPPDKNREAGQESASESPGKSAPTNETAGVSSKGASP